MCNTHLLVLTLMYMLKKSCRSTNVFTSKVCFNDLQNILRFAKTILYQLSEWKA